MGNRRSFSLTVSLSLSLCLSLSLSLSLANFPLDGQQEVSLSVFSLSFYLFLSLSQLSLSPAPLRRFSWRSQLSLHFFISLSLYQLSFSQSSKSISWFHSLCRSFIQLLVLRRNTTPILATELGVVTSERPWVVFHRILLFFCAPFFLLWFRCGSDVR